MPKLSVLMPTYNSGGFIRRAVTSTLRALPADSQLCILDDGSTDNTLTYIESIRDPRLTLYRNEVNLGVAKTLQIGLEQTSSLFVARMDADDVCLQWRFNYSLAALEKYDGIFTGAFHFGGAFPRITKPVLLEGKGFNLTLSIENPFTHSTFTGKRAVIERVGGYHDVMAEDYDLWLRMVADGASLARLRAPTICYRHHPQQVTRIKDWREKALAEPIFRNSYSMFSQAVFGAEAYWLDSLVKLEINDQTKKFLELLFANSTTEPWLVQNDIRHRVERIFHK